MSGRRGSPKAADTARARMRTMSDSETSALTSPAEGPVALNQSWLGSDRLLEWIIACQSDPATGTAYLGGTAEGVRAELDGLDQDWTDTVRVVTVQGQPVAACAVEWDEEPATAWIQGPWGSEDAVEAWGEPLIRAMVEQLPAEITTLEICGEVRNSAMADLADRLGWQPTEVNHAMVLPVEAARSVVKELGSVLSTVTVRDALEDDLPSLAHLHESEFPDAYATTSQLLTRHLTVVTTQDEQVLGYASGQIQDDGQAYIDFTAVDPAARRRGLGRTLILALTGRLVETADPDRLTHVHLTVQEEKTSARALYESVGFRTDVSLRGYRGPRPLD